jgi:hypothetical protein
LNTNNLPNPTIPKGNKHFDVLTYTGVTGNQTLTGLNFAPDFIWGKSRSTVVDNHLQSSLLTFSGSTAWMGFLLSNSTSAELNTGGGDYQNITSTGYDVVGDNTRTGANGLTYVTWNWNAGGSTVTNTNGTITSQVRANPTAGFSIVSYTSTGANATVGHGLGVAPSMIFIKNKASGTTNWPVYHKSLTAAGEVFLNATNAYAADSTLWQNTSPTSTVFSVGTNANLAAGATIAYCFAEVAGYSRFGSYIGNGVAEGPFVYTGFRPRYVLVKRSDSTGNWFIWDSARDVNNTVLRELYSDSTSAEFTRTGSSDSLDFVSNGFKIRLSSTYADRNASGGTYIFMAFAENPFKYSLAR